MPDVRFRALRASAPAVSALVLDGAGRMLLGRRAHDPDVGLWDVLGGFVDEGEHPLDALRRELDEETGLEVEPGAFLGAFIDTYGRRPRGHERAEPRVGSAHRLG